MEGIKTSTSVVRIQAASHKSWQQAVAGLASAPTLSQHPSSHLLMFFRTGYHLCKVDSPDELMAAVLKDTVAVLGAQRGSIVLADENGTLRLRRAARAGEAPRFKKWYSKTLVQRCFSNEESLLCQDVGNDFPVLEGHSTLRQSMSSIICALLRTPRRTLGVLHLDRGPSQEPFSTGDFSLADAIAASISAGLETAQLMVHQRELFLQTVSALARAVELRDQYTGSHTQRVTDYALLLADELRLSPDDHQVLKIGTPLHDIGKIGIEDAILRKPGPLTALEFENMKSHPLIGASLLESIPGLRPMIPIIRHHHERAGTAPAIRTGLPAMPFRRSLAWSRLPTRSMR